jgi:hypothetical protein
MEKGELSLRSRFVSGARPFDEVNQGKHNTINQRSIHGSHGLSTVHSECRNSNRICPVEAVSCCSETLQAAQFRNKTQFSGYSQNGGCKDSRRHAQRSISLITGTISRAIFFPVRQAGR